MKPYKFILSTLLYIGILSSAWAQTNNPIQEKQNNRMRSSINSRYRGVDYDNIDWQSTTDGYYQGSFDYQGKRTHHSV
ncbi:hypothetical protein LVD15_23700 [Fulvivirga maritima]|uniref:hypothetical protein n=1 Tax=Fulvivirga maritima TaxID=2904247 RepID=UPI001F3FEA96|nr:hypothetical protein [Fulvivirga maritima]UII26267.1 hypothetical protein LVD15_23700 [Fulvivirga maritima]